MDKLMYIQCLDNFEYEFYNFFIFVIMRCPLKIHFFIAIC